jgi:hypothetical protein
VTSNIPKRNAWSDLSKDNSVKTEAVLLQPRRDYVLSGCFAAES